MDGFKLKNIINVIDLIVISYLLDTLVLSFFIPDLGLKLQPILFRILAFGAIGFIIFNNNKRPNKITAAIRFFYPVVLLSYVYGETAIFNTIFFKTSFDISLANIENNLFGFQPSLVFADNYNSVFIRELLNFSYFSYYLFVFGFAILAWKSSVELGQKVLFVIINSFIIYYVFFIIFPSFGPQYYFLNGKLPPPQGFFPKLIHLIQYFGEADTGAFPSSHVGMMVIFVIVAAKYYRKFLFLTLFFTILIIPATVYIKAHYAIDIIGGIISAPIIYFVSVKMYFFSKRLLDEF